MSFIQKLERLSEKNNSLLCIGLDPVVNKIPAQLRNRKNAFFLFNKLIIESTHDLVCCYKPNIAFYAAHGTKGLAQLQDTIDYIHDQYTGIPAILDAKRGDIASTAEQYAREAFEIYKADAVTVNPYLGLDSIEPFLKYREKGVIILCRTSNQGAGDFQDLLVRSSPQPSPVRGEDKGEDEKSSRSARTIKPLYLHVVEQIVSWNKKHNNCLMVVGATWPEQLREIREIAPEMFFLIPGIGSQGGDIEKTLRAGLRKDRSGLIISASRSIIYADSGEQIRKEAQMLSDRINQYRYGSK